MPLKRQSNDDLRGNNKRTNLAAPSFLPLPPPQLGPGSPAPTTDASPATSRTASTTSISALLPLRAAPRAASIASATTTAPAASRADPTTPPSCPPNSPAAPTASTTTLPAASHTNPTTSPPATTTPPLPPASPAVVPTPPSTSLSTTESSIVLLPFEDNVRLLFALLSHEGCLHIKPEDSRLSALIKDLSDRLYCPAQVRTADISLESEELLSLFHMVIWSLGACSVETNVFSIVRDYASSLTEFHTMERTQQKTIVDALVRGNRFGLDTIGLRSSSSATEAEIDTALGRIREVSYRQYFYGERFRFLVAYKEVMLSWIVPQPTSFVARIRSKPIPDTICEVEFGTVEEMFRKMGGRAKLHWEHIEMLNNRCWKPSFNY